MQLYHIVPILSLVWWFLVPKKNDIQPYATHAFWPELKHGWSIPVAKQQPWLDPWGRRWSSESFKVIASTHTLLVSTENTRSVHKTQRAKDWNLQSWGYDESFLGWIFVFQFFFVWVVFNLLFNCLFSFPLFLWEAKKNTCRLFKRVTHFERPKSFSAQKVDTT